MTAESYLEEFDRFVETNLPLSAFATLTLNRASSILHWDGMFNRWIDVVQQENRLTLGWLRAYEKRPTLHAHAVLLTRGRVDFDRAETLWLQVSGNPRTDAAEVRPYQPGRRGLVYVLKSIRATSTEDVVFSDNFSLFSPRAEKGRNARERRTARRIQEQLDRGRV